MPFPPHASLTFPHDPPDIEIRFEGLLLLIPELQPGPKTYCDIGVMREPQHTLKFVVTDADTGATVPQSIKTPVQIHSSDRGVFKYRSTNVSAFDDVRDFRWAVDLKALHPGSSPKGNPGRLFRAITLKDGLLFTAVLTNPADHAVHLVDPRAGLKCWDRIAVKIGCYLTLGTGEKLTFTWKEVVGGVEVVKTFVLPQVAGQRYAVSITNLPPPASPVHDDFQAYYDYAIDTLDPKYGLNFYERIRSGGSGVDAPCMSGSQDGDGRT